MEASGSKANTDTPVSATPRWLKGERALVIASGLSLSAAVWGWTTGGQNTRVPSGESAVVIVAVTLPYAGLLYPLSRSQGHRLLHWVVSTLSCCVALITPAFAFIGLLATGLSGWGSLSWALPLAASACHAVLFVAAAVGYCAQGGSGWGVSFALLCGALLGGAAASFILISAW